MVTETIVILAGGMSSRMKTSKDTELENEKVEQANKASKSLITFGNNKPFIFYLLKNISLAGFKNVILLVSKDYESFKNTIEKFNNEFDFNIQFAIQGDTIYILEVNPRASRTVPFVSKAIGKPLAKIAAKVMVGQSLKSQNFIKEITPKFYSVKEAVFPFIKFPGVDTILGPEMKSTGEVMGTGDTFAEAFIKSQLGASTTLPFKGKAFLSVRKEDHENIIDIAKSLIDMGFELVATKGTAKIIKENKYL